MVKFVVIDIKGMRVQSWILSVFRGLYIPSFRAWQRPRMIVSYGGRRRYRSYIDVPELRPFRS